MSQPPGPLKLGARPLGCYDPQDSLWHERLVLSRGLNDKYIVATPIFGIDEEDLGDNKGVRRLGPRGGLPRGSVAGRCFRSDTDELELLQEDLFRQGAGLAEPLQAEARPHRARGRGLHDVDEDDCEGHCFRREREEEDHERYLREVRHQRRGAAPDDEGESLVWVAREAWFGYQFGGTAVPGLVASGRLRGDRGVAALPAGGALAACHPGTMTAPEPGEKGFAPIQLLPRHDRLHRRLPAIFAERANVVLPSAQLRWKVQGPRTAEWLVNEKAVHNTAPWARHFRRRSVQGLVAADAGVDEHRLRSELLEHRPMYDGLDVVEFLAYQAIACGFQPEEEAYGASLWESEMGSAGAGDWLDERPSPPGGGRSRGHALVSPELEECVAVCLQKEPAELSGRRKAREESVSARSGGGDLAPRSGAAGRMLGRSGVAPGRG